MNAIQNEIVRLAKSYINETETPGNGGFTDKEFQQKMEHVGWQKGFPWCAFFAELVWTDAYHLVQPALATQVEALFSGSAVETWGRFRKANWPTGPKPQVGALVIFRHGNTWQGHVGIVGEVLDGGAFMLSIEGNTSAAGSREGTTVLPKKRAVAAPFKADGLNVVGFVYPR